MIGVQNLSNREVQKDCVKDEYKLKHVTLKKIKQISKRQFKLFITEEKDIET